MIVDCLTPSHVGAKAENGMLLDYIIVIFELNSCDDGFNYVFYLVERIFEAFQYMIYFSVKFTAKMLI